MLEYASEFVIYLIGMHLHPIDYDSLRTVSRRMRATLHPLEYSTQNNVAMLVNKINMYGGWGAIQKHLSYTSLEQAHKMYAECLILCVYKKEGVSLDKVQGQYTEKEWIELVYKFIYATIMHTPFFSAHVTNLLDKCTPLQLHTALALVWDT